MATPLIDLNKKIKHRQEERTKEKIQNISLQKPKKQDDDEDVGFQKGVGTNFYKSVVEEEERKKMKI